MVSIRFQDKQFQYSPDDAGKKALLADATRYFEETNKKIPELFNIKPKAPCVVMAVEKFREKSVGGAFYLLYVWTFNI